MTLGFTNSKFNGGFRSIWAIDNDAAAVRTFNANFGDHAICDDIETWAAPNVDLPKTDVVIGGPPCQGFSLLNKKRNGDQRRALWRPYMDIVEKTNAKVFVIENVQELLNSSEHDDIRNRAAELGFKTTSQVLIAADYGTPQTRRRVMILGWKTALGVDPQFPPLKTHSASKVETNLPPRRTVRDAIGDLPEPVGTQIRDKDGPLNLHFGRSPTDLSKKRYRVVPEGGNRFDLQRLAPHLTPNCWIKKTSGGTDLYGRLWWDRPSVTIRTEFFKPEKGRYLHPTSHRPITHREAARLMGFPDDFAFLGSKIEIARQIGNAVPPDMGGAVGRCVKELLDSASKKTPLAA